MVNREEHLTTDLELVMMIKMSIIIMMIRYDDDDHEDEMIITKVI